MLGGQQSKYRRPNSRGAFVGGPRAVGGSRKCASVFHEYDDSAVVHAGMMHAYDDDALREAVPLAEREKSCAAYNRAKGFAGGGRGFMIVIQNAREDALL